MNHSSDNGYLVSKGYAWYIFFLLFALMFFDFCDRSILVSLFPFLKRDWGLSDSQCGVLAAAVHWSITLFAIPAAVMADRWSRKNTVGLMSVIWSLCTIACAFTRNFSQLITARFLLGAGEAGYIPVGNALISALFPARLRASLMGLLLGAASVGAAGGIVLGGWIATHFGWRHAFGVLGVPGLIFAIMFFFTRDYKTVSLTVTTDSPDGTVTQRKMKSKEILQNIIAKKSLMLLYLAETAGLFFSGGFGAWIVSYFFRVNKLTVPQAGARAGAIMVVCILGNWLVGMIADKWVTRGRTNARPLVAAAFQIYSAVLLLIAFVYCSGNAQFIVLLICGVTMSSYGPPIYASVTELVHAGLRSTAVSTMTLVQNLLGFGVGPIVVGMISDKYGLSTAMIVLSFVPVVCAIFCLLSALTYNRDLATVEKVELEMEEKHSRSHVHAPAESGV